jgi:hypothetical protein
MLAVCFLSYFPQWEIATTYTDNCSLDAGRINVQGIPLRNASSHWLEGFPTVGKCQRSMRQYCIAFYSIMQESSVATEYYKPNGIKHLQRFFPYYSIIL